MRTGMGRWSARVFAALLLAALGLAPVQHALAVVGTAWWAITSWDSASTHDLEALASLAVPPDEAARRARELVAPPPPALVATLPPRGSIVPRHDFLSGRVTRGPPIRPSA